MRNPSGKSNFQDVAGPIEDSLKNSAKSIPLSLFFSLRIQVKMHFTGYCFIFVSRVIMIRSSCRAWARSILSKGSL